MKTYLAMPLPHFTATGNDTGALFGSLHNPEFCTMQKEDSHHIKMPAYAWSTKCR
jgi:hypothetical protein